MGDLVVGLLQFCAELLASLFGAYEEPSTLRRLSLGCLAMLLAIPLAIALFFVLAALTGFFKGILG